MIGRDIYGYSLKGASTIAKALFLFWVVPGLPEGVFTDYFLLFTASVIVARFAGFGGFEAFTKRMAGDPETQTGFVSIWAGLFTLSVLTLPLTAISPNLMTIPWGLVVASNALLLGCARLQKHVYFEIGVNLPWLMFLPLCVAFNADSVSELFGLQYFSFLSTQVLVGILALGPQLIRVRLRALGRGLRQLSNMIGEFAGFQLISLNELLFLRGSLVVPDWLGLALLTDRVALLFSVFEAIWQFFMVPVNRRFSEYVVARRRISVLPILANGLAYLGSCGLAFAVLLALQMLGISPIDVAGFSFLVVSVLALTLLNAMLLIDVRNYSVSHGRAISVARMQLALVAIYLIAVVIEVYVAGFLLYAPLIACGAVIWILNRLRIDATTVANG